MESRCYTTRDVLRKLQMAKSTFTKLHRQGREINTCPVQEQVVAVVRMKASAL